MKNLFFLCLFFSVFTVTANDTLTRAQVYNFDVGDTFDYQSTSYGDSFDHVLGSLEPYTVTQYTRCIVAKIYYSTDSSTRYIIRRWVYPQPMHTDTLTVTNLSEYEIYYDTGGCAVTGTWGSYSMGSSSPYNGRSVDTIWQYSCSGPGSTLSVYADGLGLVFASVAEGGPGIITSGVFELIYYAKGGEIWGTPYYDLLTGISQLPSNKNGVTIFPSVNDGNFVAKVEDENLLPVTLKAYDITGREIKQAILSNLNNAVNLQTSSQGIYIWSAYSCAGIIEQGKMVVH